MKKLIIILFLSIYLLFSVGMTLLVHFCGEAITSVELIPFNSQSNFCCCDDSQGFNECCKNEIKSIQISDEQLVTKVTQSSVLSLTEDIRAEILLTEFDTSNLIYRLAHTKSPPEESPLYILNHSLLI